MKVETPGNHLCGGLVVVGGGQMWGRSHTATQLMTSHLCCRNEASGQRHIDPRTSETSVLIIWSVSPLGGGGGAETEREREREILI